MNIIKKCNFCHKELPKPENTMVRNYKYCDDFCRNKYNYYYKGGYETQKNRQLNMSRLPDDDKTQCRICGLWFKRVGSHVFLIHRITAQNYRGEYRLVD